MPQLKTVIEHYKICALWASVDRDPKAAEICALWSSVDRDPKAADDDKDPDMVPVIFIHKEWSEEAEEAILVDCLRFCEVHMGILKDWEPEQVGHSFFLSRNGHGAGFLDFPDKGGRILQASARAYRSSQPYIGDDGKTYLQ